MDGTAQPEDPLLGRQLAGYEIRRRLGHGGMADVYLAHQGSMQRDVAVKVMRSDLSRTDPTFHQRFKREARTIAALEHVHILPVIDYGEVDGLDYLVMRLMHNNLQDYLGQDRLLDPPEVARLLIQIAAGLDYAHQHGVVHRDLKSPNVLLDDQKNCFLADFGIAHLVDSSVVLTTEGSIIGTITHMAPEIIQGEPASKSSDIYALGIMLYEMLSGLLPFQGETYSTIIHQHLNVAPSPISQRRADLSSRCQDVVAKALAKQPGDRYPSAGALAKAFTAAIEAEDGEPDLIDSPVDDSLPAPFFAVDPVTQELDLSPTSTKPGWLRGIPVLLLAIALTAIVIVALNALSPTTQVSSPSSPTASATVDAAVYNDACLNALAILDYNAVILNCEEAIRLDPSYAAAHFNLGVAHEEMGDLESARVAYENALAQDTQLLLGRYRLAELLLDAEEVEAGFQVVDLGVRILEQGQIDLDDEDRDRITFLLFSTRGRAYLLRGESSLSLAENDLQQALVFKEVVPYPASAYYYLAQVYDAQDRPDDAQQAWFDVLATYDSNSAYQREWADQARTAIAN